MELTDEIRKLINAINAFQTDCESKNISKDDMETSIIDCLELCDIHFSR